MNPQIVSRNQQQVGIAAGASGAEERHRKLGILYENAEWLLDLFNALRTRGIPFDPLEIHDAAFLLHTASAHALYLNRVSPSSYLRGHGPAIRFASTFMGALEEQGTRFINGSRSFRLETSKVSQYQLLERLGVHTPRTVVFNNRRQVRNLTRDFPFPAILKPDTGGSGAYVRRVESLSHLEKLLDGEQALFGPDHLLLLQEYITSADGSIVRTEFVDGELLFAMRVRPTNTFNLCPAQACVRTPALPVADAGKPKVEFSHYADIPADAVAQAREIVREARLDVGGVEYIEAADGKRYFYDINATSVYRPDVCADAQVNALEKLVDFIAREYTKELAKKSRPANNRNLAT
ncbi:MAG: hypothetical protein V3T77_02625 [Planctomycetota bacterium]